MQLPLSWIEELVKPQLPPEKLASLLTLSGTEVEKIEKRSVNFHGVVVGQVRTVVQHPSADRLKVTRVVVQDKQAKPFTIVCGAPNVAATQKVAVALPGAKLANGTMLEKATIRGVESEGMLCALDELGLGSDHTGILVLGDDLKLGTPLEKALALTETILHFELTPNRSDCFSVLGVAREISVLTKKSLKYPAVKLKEGKQAASRFVKVTIRDKALCSRYVARVVRGVTVKPSPQWLKNRLEASGIRPINNVVDVTNYVMLELGQPLHAFDGRQVKSRSIIVRRARKGEKTALLDGITRALTADMPVIADPAKSLVVAGIMGGEGSGVSERTKDVIIESATFNPIAIRKACQALGLRTEASHRHEKGPDPAVVTLAADRAAQLIAELAGGEIAKGAVEAGTIPLNPKTMQFSLAEAEALLGVNIGEKQASDWLIRLGCAVERLRSDWRVAPPTWRGDLKIQEDLTEELGRLADYNTFPKTRLAAAFEPRPLPPLLKLELRGRDYFTAIGYSEVLTYPYYSQQHRDLFGLAKIHFEPLKPLSPDQQYLRQSLTPRLVEAVAKNRANGETIRLFEIGSLFFPTKKGSAEPRVLGAAVLDQDAYRQVRGVLEDFVSTGGVPLAATVEGNVATFAAGQDRVATIAAYSPEAVRALKIRSNHPLAVLELNLTVLSKLWKDEQTFKPFSQFPAVRRDLAFWLPKSQPYAPVHDVLKTLDSLITDVELFDVFEKDNQRSYAVHLTFQAGDRTLTAEEVDSMLERARTLLKKQFLAEIRS